MEINIKCSSSETKIIADLVSQLQSRQSKLDMKLDPKELFQEAFTHCLAETNCDTDEE